MRKKIYLSGGMASISKDESNLWRRYIEDELKYEAEIFNPVWYYNYENPYDFDNDKEVMDFDLYNLRSSDLVIVNFNVPESIGTAQELALAYEWHKPILGLNEKSLDIHPWLKVNCVKMFIDKDELIQYVKCYYLV